MAWVIPKFSRGAVNRAGDFLINEKAILLDYAQEGDIDGLVAEETVKQALDPILKEDIDVIVLGCTHFPVLKPVIERVTHHKIHIIDSSQAVARRTHYVLEAEGLIQPDDSNSARSANLRVWCSGDARIFSNVAHKILGYTVYVQQARL